MDPERDSAGNQDAGLEVVGELLIEADVRRATGVARTRGFYERIPVTAPC